MPDFTLIDGGGVPPDLDAHFARQALITMIVELLRALARGGDQTGRVSEALISFNNHASHATVRMQQLIDEAISRIHEEALAADDLEEFETGTNAILIGALRVTAESIANDNAARGRRSKRLDELERAMEREIQRRERRSRENGWSYVKRLTEGVPQASRSSRPTR